MKKAGKEGRFSNGMQTGKLSLASCLPYAFLFMETGRAFSAIRDSENCTPDFEPHMMPATSATMPDTDQTMTQIVRNDMPTESAA